MKKIDLEATGKLSLSQFKKTLIDYRLENL